MEHSLMVTDLAMLASACEHHVRQFAAADGMPRGTVAPAPRARGQQDDAAARLRALLDQGKLTP